MMLVFIIVKVRKAKLCVVLEKQHNYLATRDCFNLFVRALVDIHATLVLYVILNIK